MEPKKRISWLSPWAQERLEDINALSDDKKKVTKAVKKLIKFFEE